VKVKPVKSNIEENGKPSGWSPRSAWRDDLEEASTAQSPARMDAATTTPDVDVERER
jgi:hypothetical protein